MPKFRRHFLILGIVAIIACNAFLFFAQHQLAAAEDLPKQLSDEAFWKMISDFSEPGGFFRSDNFVSNETTFQFVIPDLRRNTKPGGVYLGVGPDQNFTYIVALQPKIAFIVDIRHQNMLEHLIYKALIEQSADRADLLSLLFSRKRPAGIGVNSTAEALFHAYEAVEPNPKLFEENLRKIKDTLEIKHGFKLSQEEEDGIEYIYRNFLIGGLDLTYNGSGNFAGGGYVRGGRMPTYEEIQTTDDGNGVNRAYMGSEGNFKILQDLEKKNLIVPLTGDFGGPKAIRAVGQYLKDHGTSVTAIYVSNVEQYLFQDDGWSKYYSNVATLPLDSTSTFIRSVFNMNGYAVPSNGTFGAMRSATFLCPVQEVVKAYKAGQIRDYSDVIRMSRLPQKR